MTRPAACRGVFDKTIPWPLLELRSIQAMESWEGGCHSSPRSTPSTQRSRQLHLSPLTPPSQSRWPTSGTLSTPALSPAPLGTSTLVHLKAGMEIGVRLQPLEHPTPPTPSIHWRTDGVLGETGMAVSWTIQTTATVSTEITVLLIGF